MRWAFPPWVFLEVLAAQLVPFQLHSPQVFPVACSASLIHNLLEQAALPPCLTESLDNVASCCQFILDRCICLLHCRTRRAYLSHRCPSIWCARRRRCRLCLRSAHHFPAILHARGEMLMSLDEMDQHHVMTNRTSGSELYIILFMPLNPHCNIAGHLMQ